MAFAKEDKLGMIALSAATEVSLALDPRYQYTIYHTGDDVSGTDDANSASSAWLSTLSATITADKSIEDEKYELVTDSDVTIGPGISTLYIVSVASADAVLQVVRIGTPTNSY